MAAIAVECFEKISGQSSRGTMMRSTFNGFIASKRNRLARTLFVCFDLFCVHNSHS